jgi:phosphomannomutase
MGRDARISGPMISGIVCQTLIGCGIHVIDLGLSTTPTVEVAVPDFQAQGGIIITASHNPKQWNALKLLNHKGEFISAEDGERLLALAEDTQAEFAEVDQLGSYRFIENGYIDEHIDKILAIPLVDDEKIRTANFTIAIDAVNSSGGIAIPKLLDRLGVKNIHSLFCEPNGHFPHNPEPLPEHLTELSFFIQKNQCHLGIVVDPDVDRLAFVCEDGSMFGEEYTLVAIADFILRYKNGNTVSNLSSTRALRDVTEKAGGTYTAAAVGEVNVVKKMKEVHAVIGGEGNGGVIYPELHYGRDALVGIALFLSHLAETEMKVSELRDSYPSYVISKNKIELEPSMNVDEILEKVKLKYASQPINTEDGVKIEFGNEWVHLRKSNTEPIIRIYAESVNMESSHQLAHKIMDDIRSFI